MYRNNLNNLILFDLSSGSRALCKLNEYGKLRWPNIGALLPQGFLDTFWLKSQNHHNGTDTLLRFANSNM